MTSFTVAGDNDQWMVFPRRSAGSETLFIRARLNPELTKFAESRAVVVLSAIPLKSEMLRNGTWSKECDQRFCDFEDQLVAKLEKTSGKSVELCVVSGGGRRDFYFSVSDSDVFMAISKAVADEADVAVESRLVSVDRLIILQPTELEAQLSGDMDVVSNLMKNGDHGDVPRKVEFYFYGDRVALTTLVSDLRPRGYVIEKWLNDPHGLILFRTMSVEMSIFDVETPILVQTAARRGVEYDGWESPIIRQSH